MFHSKETSALVQSRTRKLLNESLVCIHTTGTSPSGAHQQPWSYVVVTSPSVKQAIRQIVEYEEEINYKKRMAREWVDALKPINVNWIKPYIDDAPYIILVFKQLYSRNSDGVRQAHYYSEHGTSISVGILLAAIHVSLFSSDL